MLRIIDIKIENEEEYRIATTRGFATAMNEAIEEVLAPFTQAFEFVNHKCYWLHFKTPDSKTLVAKSTEKEKWSMVKVKKA